MRAANGDQLGSETNYSRYNSNFVDRYFNGTSAASPVVAGVVALFLESKPSATSGEVLDFIKTQASQMLSDTEWLNPYPTDNNAEYWRDNFNNRGAASRVLFDPTHQTLDLYIGVNMSGISFNNHNLKSIMAEKVLKRRLTD